MSYFVDVWPSVSGDDDEKFRHEACRGGKNSRLPIKFSILSLLFLLVTLSILISACGGGGGSSTTIASTTDTTGTTGTAGTTGSTGVSNTSVTITGTLSAAASKPFSGKSSQLYSVSNWSGSTLQVIDASGTVVGTGTVNADGSYSVSVPTGSNYFIRVQIGNLVLKAFVPTVSASTSVPVNTTTTAEVLILAQTVGVANIGDPSVNATTALSSVSVSGVMAQIETNASLTILASSLATEIASNYNPAATTPTIGSASTSTTVASTVATISGTITVTGDKSVVAKTTTLSVGSTQCPNGGILVKTGIDTNGNGALDASEVLATEAVCNGAAGTTGATGLNALVNVTTEQAGANCASGGVKIDSGLDSNANSTLDTSEITSTKYTCNGTNGTNAVNPYDNHYVKQHSGGAVTSFVCTGTGSKTTTEFYPLASNGTGTPDFTCTSEACSTTIANGSKSYTKQSGGTGCVNTIWDSIFCHSGYAENGAGACVAVASAYLTQATCQAAGYYWWSNSCNTSCPTGQIVTSRACEIPISTCTQFQAVQDNLCVNLTFTTVAANTNICGIYNTPIQVATGQHLLTCDATFNGKVIFDAGVAIQADNDYRIFINNDIYAAGVANNHITFGSTTTNLAGSWSGLYTSGYPSKPNLYFNYATGYQQGNYFNFVDISGVSNRSYYYGLSLGSIYIDNSTFTGTFNATFSNAYINNSSFANSSINIYDSYGISTPSFFLRSSTSAATTSNLSGTFAAWSTFGNTSTTFTPSSYHDTTVMFSTINSAAPSCSGAFIYGNKIAATLPVGCVNQADNSTLAVSNKIGVYILEPKTTLALNQALGSHVYVLDSLNWITNATVAWGATYDVNAAQFTYGATWSGYNPLVSFNSVEAYKLNINTVNGSSLITGKASVPINVW